jgi:transcription elongation factor SPT4
MALRKEKLRACLRCQFVQSPRDFHLKGCPNCEPVLEVSAAMLVAPCGPGVHSTTFLLFTLCRQQMQGSQDRVAECTTSNFDGMISMLRPDESWVAKWQRIGEFPLPTHTIHAYPPTLCSSFSLAYRLLACVLHRETAAGAVRGQGGGTASRRTGIVASGDGTNVLLLNASAPVRWW